MFLKVNKIMLLIMLFDEHLFQSYQQEHLNLHPIKYIDWCGISDCISCAYINSTKMFITIKAQCKQYIKRISFQSIK